MASIAVSYSLRIVTIVTQFYGWRVYSGCNYLITISDRILGQDIWQFKTLLNLLAAIDPLASGGSLLVFLSIAVRHRYETTLRNYLFTVRTLIL
jgi:hypothetical protein